MALLASSVIAAVLWDMSGSAYSFDAGAAYAALTRLGVVKRPRRQSAGARPRECEFSSLEVIHMAGAVGHRMFVITGLICRHLGRFGSWN